jgi:hypothetical protein
MSNPRSSVRVTREQLARLTTDPQVIRFFESLMRRSFDDAAALVLGVSPYTYIATADLSLVVTGGTVSQLAYNRNGTNTNIGITAGLVPILAGDGLTITYTVAPTVTMIPSQ